MSNKVPTFSILIHYSEIGLKKNNRTYFEKIFMQNIFNHVKDLKHKKIYLLSARVFIEDVNPNDWDIFKNRLKKVMGLSNATLMLETISDYDAIKNSIGSFINDITFDSFRVTTRRHSKKFEKTSIDMNIELGSYIQKFDYETEKREDVLYGYPNEIISYPVMPSVAIPMWFAEGTAQYMYDEIYFDCVQFI